MSEQWMLKTLVGLGLREMDAKVYVFLATKGPREAKGIADALKLSKQQLHCCLKNLQDKSIVNTSPKCPARFSAVIFERVLDIFLKAKIEQQQILQETREELLSSWKNMTKKNSKNS